MTNLKKISLNELRGTLIRLEETIIFALIERAQFKRNEPVYQDGAIPIEGFEGSFCEFLLYETEKVHARVRRYTAPDEFPFFDDLPQPVLEDFDYEHQIIEMPINYNKHIFSDYTRKIIPAITEWGDCKNYGSSATADVNALQAVSKRIHYGMYIAEAKFQSDLQAYSRLIRQGDSYGILKLLKNPEVEAKLLERVSLKAATYGRDPGTDEAYYKVEPETIADIYEHIIIPMTCDVEVEYLLNRLDYE
ncbi:MAG: chorismate mutase [Lentisphaeria bacterium]|nr:chorismate mutase [Lentisphaeria bacterium]